eukprot:365665-Chlamydomonas_euryale.AAC.16
MRSCSQVGSIDAAGILHLRVARYSRYVLDWGTVQYAVRTVQQIPPRDMHGRMLLHGSRLTAGLTALASVDARTHDACVPAQPSIQNPG